MSKSPTNIDSSTYSEKAYQLFDKIANVPIAKVALKKLYGFNDLLLLNPMLSSFFLFNSLTNVYILL